MPVKINVKEKTAEIDLSENRIFIVKNGKIEYEDAPESGFGEHAVIWKDGKVVRIDKRSTRII